MIQQNNSEISRQMYDVSRQLSDTYVALSQAGRSEDKAILVQTAKTIFDKIRNYSRTPY